MQKIGVLLISVAIIGFTNASLIANCSQFSTLLEADRCCAGLKRTSYDDVYDNCLKEHADTPNPEYCASECAVNKTGLINPDRSFNYTNLRTVIEYQTNDSEIVEHAINTIKACELLVTQMMRISPYYAKIKPCDPGFNLMQRCIAILGIRNCPTGKWAEFDLHCTLVLKDALSCEFDY